MLPSPISQVDSSVSVLCTVKRFGDPITQKASFIMKPYIVFSFFPNSLPFSIIPASRAHVPNKLQQSKSLSAPLFWGNPTLRQLSSSFPSLRMGYNYIHLTNCSWHLSGFYWECKIKETDKHCLHQSYVVVRITIKSPSFSIVSESGLGL